jgi:hypothetical protein
MSNRARCASASRLAINGPELIAEPALAESGWSAAEEWLAFYSGAT